MRPNACSEGVQFRQCTGQRLEMRLTDGYAIAEDLSPEAPAQTTKNPLASGFRRFLTAGRETGDVLVSGAGIVRYG